MTIFLGSVSSLTRDQTRCPASQVADVTGAVTARKCLDANNNEIKINGVSARCFETTLGVAAGASPSLSGYDHCS